MKSELLEEDGRRTFALVFDIGDEVMGELESFAEKQGVTGASFTAIGAFRRVTLAYFDWESRAYEEIPIEEQVEVLSLIGNVAEEEGLPKVHAHVVLGLPDGSTRGGHLMEGEVRPTLELVLVDSPARLARHKDEETGLTLIEPGE